MAGKGLFEYETEKGGFPFTEWLCSKKVEVKTRAIIDARLNRLMIGLVGDCEPVGKGVFELRVHFGPGFRVYFTYSGKEDILLLCGGNKNTQKRDIQVAHEYWEDFKRRNQL